MFALVSRPLGLLAAFALTLAPAALANGPERVGDFALIDHTGQHHQLSYYSDQKAVVLVAHGLTEAADLALPASSDDVTILYINALPSEGRAALAEAMPSDGGPVLVDESQTVSASVGFERVGDMLIVDPVRMLSRYRGNVGELGDVLPSILAGK